MIMIAMLATPSITMPDASATALMLYRWLHFLAGITWIGMLYFFNLVNVPFMKEMDSATKGKVVPSLMPRALWWFRWGAVVTVLAGLVYWGEIVATDAHNARSLGYPTASSGAAMGTFFGIWTVVFAVMYALIMVAKVNKGPVLAVLVAVLVSVGAYLFLSWNSHGWESNRLLSIGVGGGFGWIMMMNVWGIIWRINKKTIQWTKDNAINGTAIPPQAAAMARMAFLASRANFFLSFPMLFFMGAASHYTMFGK